MRITLAKEQSRPLRYAVRLHFAETEPVEPGQRVFDVAVQGQEVLRDFDVTADAGAINRCVVKTFTGIEVTDDLSLTLQPTPSAQIAAPIISGIEIVSEEP